MQPTTTRATAAHRGRSSRSSRSRSRSRNNDAFSSTRHGNPPSTQSATPRPIASTTTIYPSTFPAHTTPAERQILQRAPLNTNSNLSESSLGSLSKRPSLTSLLRRGSTAGTGTSQSTSTSSTAIPHHRRNIFHTRRKSTSSLGVQGLDAPGHSEPIATSSTGPELGQQGSGDGPGPGPKEGHGHGHGHRLRRSASFRKLFPDDDDNPRHTRPPLPADWASVTATAPRTTGTTRTSTTRTSRTANPSIPVLATPLDATPPQSPSPLPSHPALDQNTNMYGGALIAPPPAGLGIMSSSLHPAHLGAPNEGSALHQHIHDMVNKRISTMDYLRKAHDGRVYWFNTLRFDRPDLARMSYFDARRLARRATNYMMLGLSLPAVVDLNSASATELLRSLAALMTEFEQFQQLHSESNYNGSGPSASLSRAARLPNMFRRATPGAKSRRTSSSAASGNDIGMGMGMGAVPALPTNTSFDGLSGLSTSIPGSSNGSMSGPSTFPPSSSHGDRGLTSSGTGGSGGNGNTSAVSGPGDSFSGSFGSPLTLVNSESQGSLTGLSGSFTQPFTMPQTTPLGAASTGAASTAFATYYDNNTDLLPGEEYTFLLTPSLPFDPDFYETFATLCDVLIDCYQRILSLLPSPRDCSPVIMEQFSKADSRVRKLLVQGVVKEFEEHSRSGVKMEVANVGKIVLGGLM